MKRRLFIGAGASAAALSTLGGCASQQLASYANEKPQLDLRSYFNGTLQAHGMFSDYSGTVVKRFRVRMVCTWQGDEGTLDEDFSYADGSVQKRIWHLRAGPDGTYTGRADDVVGIAQGRTVEMPSTGATPWPCRWTAASTMCKWTIGCTWSMTGSCSTKRLCASWACLWARSR